MCKGELTAGIWIDCMQPLNISFLALFTKSDSTVMGGGRGGCQR